MTVDSRDRRARLQSWGLWLLGCVLVFSAAWLAVRVLAQAVAIGLRGYWPLFGQLVTSWQLVLLVAMLVALAALWGRHPDLPSRAGFRRYRRRWLVAALVYTMAAPSSSGHVQRPNALGVSVNKPNATFVGDQGHPQRPPAHVRTNSFGFRDVEWSAGPPAGATRVAVIGDSYVYGAGIPDQAAIIGRQLEAALREARPGRRWEVMNAGYPGWGYFTYFTVARRLLRQLQPRIIVVGSLGTSDWDLFDKQQQCELFGFYLCRALARLGAGEDLKQLGLRYSRGLGDRRIGLVGERRLAAEVDALLREAAAQGADVIVWDYYEPTEFFRRWEGRPRFHMAGWPASFDRRWDGWGNDPQLAIPNDRHPTAAANAIMARTLAPIIVGLVEGGTPASSPAATRPPQ